MNTGWELTSLLFWFPKIKNLEIFIPKTEWIEIPTMELYQFLEGEISLNKYWPEIEKKAKKIGFPLFLRTDLASGKHDWKDSCFVEKIEDLKSHIYKVIESNAMADIIGLSPKALIFREYIKMESGFTAFLGHLPISKERRYFIKDGKVIEHFPYWPEDAIERSITKPSVKNWRKILKNLNKEDSEEVELLTFYAQKVASVLPDYWSVDFCCAKDGRWILIDLAEGEKSWRPGKEEKYEVPVNAPDFVSAVHPGELSDVEEKKWKRKMN